MPFRPSNVLPKRIGLPRRAAMPGVQVLPELVEASTAPADDVLRKLETSPKGLSADQAERRLDEYGPNVVGQEANGGWLRLLRSALLNPLVILLAALATVAFATGDFRAGSVMTLMVALGVSLRLVQESRADKAAARLKAMINVTATVVRDGQPREIPVGEVVPGDVVRLAAGDMIPGDVRLISSKDLFVIQASLTGESFPVEKFDATETQPPHSAIELKNICFLGTSVESGAASAVVVATGAETYLGGMASIIVGQQVLTSFDKGINKFTWLMIRFMAVMVPLVFLVNGLTKHNWPEAFFFAMAVAVGLTPEMLPMIVTVCLSKGAMAMARKKVIVKRLNSIQNLGAMDVLCTDKTGTLTMDHVILERHIDVVLKDDESVMLMAYLNSFFQTGLKNVLDRAVLNHVESHEQIPITGYSVIDEVPFDFSRKMMSVVVQTPEGAARIITKGAPEEIFKRCDRFVLGADIFPMEQILIDELKEEYENLSSDGFRVLAIAYNDLERKPAYSKDDEKGLVLKGYVAFLDPPKDTARAAIAALQKHGVSVKVVTGDNELVSRKICHEVGVPTDYMLLGGDVETMTDPQLEDVVERTTLFARLSPAGKQRVIKALQNKGHVVGFLGDGINDAPAIRAADVGISVDSAADIAKESADAILLEKSLLVLEEGVLEGRKVYANILKYVRMGASSNFGNMFSVIGASAVLPFLPMAPLQILTNNLLYDFSQVSIPTDDVDAEQIARPRPWSMNEISRFILFIGPCSSIFDYTTYFMMYYIFAARNPGDPHQVAMFQTGWFVESLLTQTLIIHIIRTNRIPFLQSRPSWPVMATTVLIMSIGIALPFTPIAGSLGLTAMPPLYWGLLLLTLACYTLLTQGVKMALLKKAWI